MVPPQELHPPENQDKRGHTHEYPDGVKRSPVGLPLEQPVYCPVSRRLPAHSFRGWDVVHRLIISHDKYSPISVRGIVNASLKLQQSKEQSNCVSTDAKQVDNCEY